MIVESEVGSSEVSEELFKDIPLTALGSRSLEMLSALLDPEKYLLSPSGNERDWRGLAKLARIPGQLYASIRTAKVGPTEKVLTLWRQQRNGPPATISNLQLFLQDMDRWDVYDDTFPLFEKDVELYKAQQSRGPPCIDTTATEEVLTVHDVSLAPEVQRYHAYVLYADEDTEFASMVIDRLKKEGLFICSENDILLGFTSALEPVMKLIKERCQKIIVILSPNFFKSGANKYYTNFAQSIAIETQMRLIVPVVYREYPKHLDNTLKFLHMVSWETKQPLYNFWDKLVKSLLANSALPRVKPEAVTACTTLAIEPAQAEAPARPQMLATSTADEMATPPPQPSTDVSSTNAKTKRFNKPSSIIKNIFNIPKKEKSSKKEKSKQKEKSAKVAAAM